MGRSVEYVGDLRPGQPLDGPIVPTIRWSADPAAVEAVLAAWHCKTCAGVLEIQHLNAQFTNQLR
jgi:hypothetical protein